MDKDYNGIMIKKYHIEEENVREQVFENVSLSSLKVSQLIWMLVI